jgi:arylsulfatase A-like enzyme
MTSWGCHKAFPVEGKYTMKRGLLLTFAILVLLMLPFVTLSYAAIGDYDLSSPKDGDVDGKDLAAWIASPGSDIASFAEAFGQTYTVATRPPNILLIIADDVGLDLTTNAYPGLISDLTAMYGPSPGRNNPNYTKINGRPASLPVLTDRLAAQGMVFANAWAQPFCSPTRATVMTGLFADKTKVVAFDEPMMSTHTTFVQLLKNANYSTAVFGKWHLAGPKGNYTGVLPKQVGFDLFKGHLDSAISPTYWSYNYLIQDEATSSTAYRTESAPTRSLPGINPTTFEPVVRAADTVEWINARQAQNPDKPWFVYLAYNESHVLVPPDTPYYHVPNADTLDAASLAEVTACGGQPGGSSVGSCGPLPLMRAMTNSMDTMIGKVLDAVETIGSDTYVIYIGDNGSWSNNIDNMYITTTNRGKTTPYESGARVPMVIRGPGIATGTRSTEFVHAADLFATILTMAGLTPPATNFNNTGGVVPSDSVSLTPILLGSASTVRDPNEGYLLTEVSWSSNTKVGARNGTYKVICSTNTSNANCTFYNLITDPLEEYPLTKPGSCSNFRTTYTTAVPEWHYCRLIEVMNNYSIFP